MLYAIGSRVRLRFTGETGKVTGALEDGMLKIRLDDDPDFEIPTFEEDLEPYIDSSSTAPGHWVLGKGKQETTPHPPRRAIKSQYHILKPKGIQMAFEPMPGKEDIVSRYKVWLINDTAFEFLLQFDLFTTQAHIIDVEDKIGAMSALELGDILSDDLNDQPEVELEIHRLTTAGAELPLNKVVKIKPKQFFNNIQTVPIINVLAHHFVLFERFDTPDPAQQVEEDLKLYTQQHARPKTQTDRHQNARPYRQFDVNEFSNFMPEIDLHIEVLHATPHKLNKGDILRIQMQACDRFIDRAVRVGAHSVFLIHGVGEGKLRESIARSLRERPEVVKFKNEYHHKYGYGATEVILR